MKNVLRKMRIVQESKPKNHARKVITGIVTSSVSGTTKATSSIGHRSVSDGFGFLLSVIAVGKQSRSDSVFVHFLTALFFLLYEF